MQTQMQSVQRTDQNVESPSSEYSQQTPVTSRSSLQVQPLTPRHRPSQQDGEENLYDATPRQSKVPAQYRDAGSNRTSVASPTEPKSVGSFQDLGAKAAEQAQPTTKTPPSPVQLVEEVPPRPVSPIIYANGDNSSAPPAAESSSKKAVNGIDDLNSQDTPPKTASMDRDLFEQAKRQQMMREQEEKIPVFIQEPDPVPAPKKDNEEIPQMSATSYPGQEWNPYGDVDWED